MPAAPRRQYVDGLAGLVGEQVVEGLGVEAVAGEDRDRLAVRAVTGRTAAAQIIVVHCRKVIVDQRIGVDQLERCGER